MGNNIPAFPTISYVGPGETMGQSIMTITGGMSLRDFFAGQAIIGMLSNERLNTTDGAVIAESAYTLADSMLEQRGKT